MTRWPTLTNTSTITNAATNINSGTFDISAGGSLDNINVGTFTQIAGSTIVDGTITGGTVDFKGGSLVGSGTIEADNIVIGANATLNPGNSAGTLIMVADTDLLGTLQTEIVSSSTYDIFEVQGEVTLADTTAFEFMFDSSYVAIDGDSFHFLSAFSFDFGAGFSDWFDSGKFMVTGLTTGFDWSVSYIDSFSITTPSYLSLILADNRNVSNPLSAPATLAMFGLVIPLLAWFRRPNINAQIQRSL